MNFGFKIDNMKLNPPVTGCLSILPPFFEQVSSSICIYAYALARPPYFLTNGHLSNSGTLENALNCINTAVNQIFSTLCCSSSHSSLKLWWHN